MAEPGHAQAARRRAGRYAGRTDRTAPVPYRQNPVPEPVHRNDDHAQGGKSANRVKAGKLAIAGGRIGGASSKGFHNTATDTKSPRLEERPELQLKTLEK